MGSCPNPIPGSPALLNDVLSVPPTLRLSVALAPMTPRLSYGPIACLTIAAAPAGPKTLAPCEDLGVLGASATRSRTVGGTDSTSFNNAGLPGIGFGQDPIEYNTHTHHTNLDNYERIIESDVQSSAMAIAATLYQLAMRDQMVPRFAPGDMPPPVARTSTAQP